MDPKIPVFVVEDHQVVREGIISLIQESGAFQVVGEAANGKIALAKIEASLPRPQVVLMDINMPVMDGIACTRELFARYQGEVLVLALTMIKQGLHIREMLQAGASGYILKNCDKFELFEAISTVQQGKPYFSQEVSQVVMNEMTKSARPSFSSELSKRELEVLQLIVRDLSNQEIADQLYISIRTVETHKQNLIAKTGTNNVAGLVVYAIRHRLVEIS